MVENQKLKLIIKENLETIDASTAHGFHNIISNRHVPVKIMWTLCLLASAGYCGKSVYDCLMQYMDYPVVTQVTVNYLQEMQFPIVKVCSFDMLYVNTSMNDFETFKINYLKSFIISCVFNNKKCDLTNDFDFFVDPLLGACLRFNSGFSVNGTSVPIKTTRSTGTKVIPQNSLGDGLTLMLLAISPSDETLAYETGFNILVSNESESSVNSQGIKVAPGFATDIVPELYVTTLQPDPYSQCIKGLTTSDAYDSNVYRRTFDVSTKNHRSYHYTDCFKFCFKKYIGDTCNVQLSPAIFGEPYYTNMTILELDTTNKLSLCALPYFSYPKFLALTDFITDCNCPLECSQTRYSVTSSFSKYPTQFEIDSYFSSGNYEYLSERIVKINVYFDKLKETIISQDIKITIIDLLGLIGGILGLFLGMSFLSFIEIFEIILQTFLNAFDGICWSKKKGNAASKILPEQIAS